VPGFATEGGSRRAFSFRPKPAGAQVSPLYERVPPGLYGGTERVVSHIVEQLVRRGHDVTLFASGDSGTGAKPAAPVARALRLDPGAGDPLAAHILGLSRVFERAHETIACRPLLVRWAKIFLGSGTSNPPQITDQPLISSWLISC